MTTTYADFLASNSERYELEAFLAEVVGCFPTLDEFIRLYGDEPRHYIYGLYDPRTEELRYVGKSIRPRERLANELNEHPNTYRGHWLDELTALGLRPIQRIIDAVPIDADWQSVERAYIAGARAAGDTLTNGTAGGDGVLGLSPESRARIVAAWSGRKHRPESIEKIRVSSRGRRHTDEWRAYMRERMKDREFSPEHRAKLSAATKKLTVEQVTEIRVLLAEGLRQRDIAARFGVHQGTISNINRGRYYS